jgi:hypothetical protein
MQRGCNYLNKEQKPEHFSSFNKIYTREVDIYTYYSTGEGGILNYQLKPTITYIMSA